MIALLAVVAVLLVPVPWKHVVSDDPPGSAWRLDGRLEIQGEIADPPGSWSWLAVGRPQLLAEVLWDEVVGEGPNVDDLREGPVAARPALNEPAAAAIGLRQAGVDIDLGMLVEVRQPLYEGFPESGLLATIDGEALDRETWQRLNDGWEDVDPRLTGDGGSTPGTGTSTAGDGTSAADAGTSTRGGAASDDVRALSFKLRGGQALQAPGARLPYRWIDAVPTAPAGFEAGISFEVVRHLPVEWVRNLSLGRSHGLMVALVAYAHASGHDLAQGRHIAGTGGILGDGTVTRIGGLPAKARAANRAGADVLFVPASQRSELDQEPLQGTTVVPVASLTDAIEWLSRPVA